MNSDDATFKWGKNHVKTPIICLTLRSNRMPMVMVFFYKPRLSSDKPALNAWLFSLSITRNRGYLVNGIRSSG